QADAPGSRLLREDGRGTQGHERQARLSQERPASAWLHPLPPLPSSVRAFGWFWDNRTAMNPAPGFKKRPDYRLSAKPAGARVQVMVNGELIADSKDAVKLEEGNYPPVYYIPRKDVKMDRLVRSPLQTHCPFKG